MQSRLRAGCRSSPMGAIDRRLCLCVELGWSIRSFLLELSEPPVVYGYIFIISLDSCKETGVLWRYYGVLLESTIYLNGF